jgi:S-adenosylmethionine-dependent methyltransferase
MADFDTVGDTFVGYYSSTRGHVREVLTRENLQDFLPNLPAKALDLGGGDGRDTEWLINQGFEVTLVDPSAEMIEKAKVRLQDSDAVNIQHLKPDEIISVLADQQFDLVLSHGVLMYCIDDPGAHLDTISQLAKPGAVVSLLTKGFGGALDRFLSHEDFNSASRLMESERCVNNLGLETWAYKPETVTEMLGRHALQLIDWFGVRVATDHDGRDISTLPQEELEVILSAERLFSKNHSTRGLGQMIHYLARRV